MCITLFVSVCVCASRQPVCHHPCVLLMFNSSGELNHTHTHTRSSVMRLQLNHCPLSLWWASSRLWREATDGGDGGRGRGERGQQGGPQAALQGAQGASCTPRHPQQGRAAVSVQKQGLIDQLLDNVHFLAPVQVQGWRSLWRLRRARGGAVIILGGGAGCLRGFWVVVGWWQRVLMFFLIWHHSFKVTDYL